MPVWGSEHTSWLAAMKILWRTTIKGMDARPYLLSLTHSFCSRDKSTFGTADRCISKFESRHLIPLLNMSYYMNDNEGVNRIVMSEKAIEIEHISTTQLGSAAGALSKYQPCHDRSDCAAINSKKDRKLLLGIVILLATTLALVVSGLAITLTRSEAENDTPETVNSGKTFLVR